MFTSKSAKAVKSVVADPVFVSRSNPIASSEISKAASVLKISVEENPMLEWIYKMYEQEGVSRDVVSRVVLGGEKQRFYRYVGQEELDRLLAGEKITSNRPCHRGSLTDVTSDPNYGKIRTLGKYRLSFKDKPEFAPYPPTKASLKSRIQEHDLKDSEYYLCGGYDISDIEKIEKKMGDGSFLDVIF